jgi:SAM-dependent methyltransferase
MSSHEYDGDYFRKTRSNVGLLLTTIRPLWGRWVKIIRRYKSDGRLLDIGCGEGYFLQYAEKYYETYGMDVSNYCISEASQRTKKTKLFLGSIAHIDYGNEFFDIITCFDILEHLDDLETAVLECRRVLKSRGVLVIRIPNTSSLGAKWKKEEWFGYKDTTHKSLLSNEGWLSVLQENNFEVLSIFYDGLWDTPYLKCIPKILQNIFIKLPSLGFFLIGVKFSRKYGENLCIVSRRE